MLFFHNFSCFSSVFFLSSSTQKQKTESYWIIKKQIILFPSPSSRSRTFVSRPVAPLYALQTTVLTFMTITYLKSAIIFFRFPFNGYDYIPKKSRDSPDWPIRTNEVSRMDFAPTITFSVSLVIHFFCPVGSFFL